MIAREGAWPAWQELQRVIEERAADPAMDRVAGQDLKTVLILGHVGSHVDITSE